MGVIRLKNHQNINFQNVHYYSLYLRGLYLICQYFSCNINFKTQYRAGDFSPVSMLKWHIFNYTASMFQGFARHRLGLCSWSPLKLCVHVSLTVHDQIWHLFSSFPQNNDFAPSYSATVISQYLLLIEFFFQQCWETILKFFWMFLKLVFCLTTAWSMFKALYFSVL